MAFQPCQELKFHGSEKLAAQIDLFLIILPDESIYCLNMKNHYLLDILIVIPLFLFNYGCKVDKVPVITTNEITNITGNSAKTGGTITDEGSDPVVLYGVCWSTHDSPTLSDDKTQDGTGSLSFTSNITGLNGSTTYYVRAYASNKAGTGYGLEQTFTTLASQATLEEILIQNFIISNPNYSFQLKPSGLYYADLIVGSGPATVEHHAAYVKYTGKFLNGVAFDTNVGKPDTLIFPVNEGWLIPGMDEGILYMRSGGKALLLIPSKLAYGKAGLYPDIPGDTPLLFEIDLVKTN